MIWEIYWLTRLVAFGEFLEVIVVLSALGLIATGVGSIAFHIEGMDVTILKKIAKCSVIGGLTALVISVFIPSKNDLLLMFGGEAAFQISNNQEVSQIVKDGLGLIQEEIAKARAENGQPINDSKGD